MISWLAYSSVLQSECFQMMCFHRKNCKGLPEELWWTVEWYWHRSPWNPVNKTTSCSLYCAVSIADINWPNDHAVELQDLRRNGRYNIRLSQWMNIISLSIERINNCVPWPPKNEFYHIDALEKKSHSHTVKTFRQHRCSLPVSTTCLQKCPPDFLPFSTCGPESDGKRDRWTDGSTS